MRDLNSKEKAYLAAEAALEKKADRITVLEMAKLFPICDYFLICSGDSARKVKAISDNIQKKFEELNIKRWHIEGLQEGQWVLLDYSDIVIHIFLTEVRNFYNLEHLWGDAPRLSFDNGNDLPSNFTPR